MTKQASTEELASLKRKIRKLEQSEAERKNAETQKEAALKALQTSEEKYRMLVESVSDVLFEIDHQGVVLHFSPVGKVTGGYDQVDVIGRSFIEFVHPDDRELLIKRFHEFTAGVEYPLTYRLITKSGKYGWVRTRTKPRMENGKFMGAIGMLTNITDQKLAEEALRESEIKYRQMFESIEDIYYITDMAGTIENVSPSVFTLAGWTPDELIGKSVMDIYADPSDREKLMSSLLKHTYVRDFEVILKNKQGTLKHVSVSARLISDADGTPKGLAGTVRDITERKQAEAKLKHTLESLRKAFSAIIKVMVSAVEIRDPYTAGHQKRSADLARAIATEMRLSQDRIDGIRMAGNIHDIGKLSVPSEILAKPTKLEEIEFSLIKAHAKKGYEMLKDVESPWPLAEIVYQHHERMDGSGYPRNLKGDDILMEARIMAVADVVEAMASHRPYRPGLGIDVALEEIEKNKGTHYDNAVVDTCLKLFREKGYQLVKY